MLNPVIKYAKLLLICLGTCLVVHSQETAKLPGKLYLKVYTGYGIFTPGSYSVIAGSFLLFQDQSTGIFYDSTYKRSAKHGLGWGPKIAIGLGWVKSDFLNLGIDLEYQKGNTISTSQTISILTAADVDKVDLKYNAVTLTPHFIFKALARPRFFIYNKLGLVLTLPFHMKETNFETDTSWQQQQVTDYFIDNDLYPHATVTQRTNSVSEYRGNFKMALGLGLNVAIGANFKLRNNWRIFGEIFGNYSSLSAKKSTTNYYNRNSNIISIDTSGGFHKDYTLEKTISNGTQYTTYTTNGDLRLISNDYRDLGTNADGYAVTESNISQVGYKVSFNMVSIGFHVGLIYRF